MEYPSAADLSRRHFLCGCHFTECVGMTVRHFRCLLQIESISRHGTNALGRLRFSQNGMTRRLCSTCSPQTVPPQSCTIWST